MELLPASQFTFEELTEAYNHTRVDYLVPMPMNVARLREYARVYNVDMESSCVVVDGHTMLGLGMLGVREKRGWITRLGVLPSGRRQGIGTTITARLLEQAASKQADTIWLEVIKGNEPAYNLFRNFGFQETRELIVARRPPSPGMEDAPLQKVKRVTSLNHEDAVLLLSHRRQHSNWINETESMQNVRNLSALVVEMYGEGRGWVTYHAGLLQLTRIVVEVTAGDPAEVTATILHVLHQRYKRQDAVAENLCDDDKWSGFQQAGYFDSFRRLEMKRRL